MAEWRTGSQHTGQNGTIWTVEKVLAQGRVRMVAEGYEPWEGPVSLLTEGFAGLRLATNNVMGLQTDPPAGIARVARDSIATVLPSPVAPETNKSGIVPDGKVKFLGRDGFLHEVPAASSQAGMVDAATVAVRED